MDTRQLASYLSFQLELDSFTLAYVAHTSYAFTALIPRVCGISFRTPSIIGPSISVVTPSLLAILGAHVLVLGLDDKLSFVAACPSRPPPRYFAVMTVRLLMTPAPPVLRTPIR